MPYLLKISYLAAERGDYKKRPIGDPLSGFFAEKGATVIVNRVHAPEIDFETSDYLQNIVDLLWLAKKTGFDELQLSLDSEPCARIAKENKERLENEIKFAKVLLGLESGSCATLFAKLKNISDGDEPGIGNMTDQELDDLLNEIAY
jgi:hypothetical protein